MSLFYFCTAECLSFQVRAEIEAGFGRLVVGYVFISHAYAVCGVFAECVEAVIGWYWRYVKAQVLVVGCAHQHFFAPVAYDIGL